LPINFFSPYKSLSIQEFWRRWHMTLSRFLRDYIYIPLGGNRNGSIARYSNLLVTMLIGGIWHGAGWNFLLWGALHGSYLVINGIYSKFRIMLGVRIGMLHNLISWNITFIAVVIAWVLFRAVTLDGASRIYEGMLGINGISLHSGIYDFINTTVNLKNISFITANGFGSFGSIIGFVWLFIAAFIAFKLPNTIELFGRVMFDNKEQGNLGYSWKLSWLWSLFCAITFLFGVFSINSQNEFLYFNF
jgi:alginate O-acetyltransferase complex protein AlgI